LRKDNDALQRGKFQVLYTVDKCFAFKRFTKTSTIIIAFNMDNTDKILDINIKEYNGTVFTNLLGSSRITVTNDILNVQVASHNAVVLKHH